MALGLGIMNMIEARKDNIDLFMIFLLLCTQTLSVFLSVPKILSVLQYGLTPFNTHTDNGSTIDYDRFSESHT